MTAEQLFSLCGPVALAAWILLIAAPRNIRATTIAGTVVPGGLSCLYLVLGGASANSAGRAALESEPPVGGPHRAPRPPAATGPNPGTPFQVTELEHVVSCLPFFS
jgi:hypothetical protein